VNGSGVPLDDNPTAQALNDLPTGSVVEACPEGLLLAQDIADRIQKCNGGAALLIDYGEDGASSRDTMRGFWRHTQVHPLSRPGEVDVTADVDFAALREAVNQRIELEDSLKRKRFANEGQVAPTSTITEQEKPNDRPEAFGPVSQGQFLASMGIVQRVERQIEADSTTDEQAHDLYSALERLLAPDQMGSRYKVLAIARKKEGLFPPPGF
jgi:NADH dehydrogenase [ubiquinone] 1 alpha subcomplex assembly factor 7